MCKKKFKSTLNYLKTTSKSLDYIEPPPPRHNILTLKQFCLGGNILKGTFPLLCYHLTLKKYSDGQKSVRAHKESSKSILHKRDINYFLGQQRLRTILD